ncbi:MAG: hypothetical protein K9K38_13955 [Rhodoferax sp.]|nr:hypothetical protein [Rhodoferax sp.]
MNQYPVCTIEPNVGIAEVPNLRQCIVPKHRAAELETPRFLEVLSWFCLGETDANCTD